MNNINRNKVVIDETQPIKRVFLNDKELSGVISVYEQYCGGNTTVEIRLIADMECKR